MPGNSRKAVAILSQLFHRNGCVRVPDSKLRKVGSQTYKKGFELRFVARSETELKQIKRLLRSAGFKPGRPFQKGRQTVQPVYGRETVKKLCAVLGLEERIP